MDLEFNGTSTLTSGQLSGQSIVVNANGVLIATVSLEISAVNDILINGLILSTNGLDISITSQQGNIFVGGGLITGPGKDGRAPGQSGTRGGNILLNAAHGKIAVVGSLRTGAGGHGQHIKQKGDAIGGPAGNGGAITLNGKEVLIRSTADIATGNGGNGGDATADGWNDQAAQEWAEIMGDTKPEVFVPDEQVSKDRLVANSGNGGIGGNITIDASQSGSLEGSMTTGHGGNAGHAKAIRTFDATAQTGRPGLGGSAEIKVNTANWTLNGVVEIGSGGSFRRAILTNPAIAAARDAALAKTAKPGAAGKFTRPNGGQTSVTDGRAGFGGTALAQSIQGACNRTDDPGTESRAAEARCPNP